jgi:hypothetical protein
MPQDRNFEEQLRALQRQAQLKQEQEKAISNLTPQEALKQYEESVRQLPDFYESQKALDSLGVKSMLEVMNNQLYEGRATLIRWHKIVPGHTNWDEPAADRARKEDPILAEAFKKGYGEGYGFYSQATESGYALIYCPRKEEPSDSDLILVGITGPKTPLEYSRNNFRVSDQDSSYKLLIPTKESSPRFDFYTSSFWLRNTCQVKEPVESKKGVHDIVHMLTGMIPSSFPSRETIFSKGLGKDLTNFLVGTSNIIINERIGR